MAKNSKVADRSPESRAFLEQVELPRTLMRGTRGMREAGEAYLPSAESEPWLVYRRRLNMSILYNGFRFSANSLSGRPFSNPLKLSENTPEAIVEWSKNVDMTGRTLHQFARDWFADIMVTGRSHILVDKPAGVPNDRSEELSMRPYFRMIRGDDVLGWKTETVDGEEMFTQFRIREYGELPDPENQWGSIPVNRVRVLYLDGWELWEENPENENEWHLRDSGESGWNRIPIVTAYGIRNGFMDSEPPLEDLAWVNLGHWQSQSDQRNILHVTRVPILFGAGFPEVANGPKKIEVAANRAMFSQDPGAKLSYVEHTGASIGAGRQDLKDFEEQMGILGMMPLIPGAVGGGATAAAISGADTQSLLQSMTLGMKEGLDQALKMMLDWVDLPGDPEVVITSEYGLALREAEHIGALIQLRLSGDISRKTLWSEFRRRDVLSDQFDPDSEQEMIDDEGPGLINGFAPMIESNNELDEEIVQDETPADNSSEQ